MNVEARLFGGPGDGRIMAIDGLKPQIVIQHLERPVSFNIGPDEDPFARVPMTQWTYAPRRAVVYYEPVGVVEL